MCEGNSFTLAPVRESVGELFHVHLSRTSYVEVIASRVALRIDLWMDSNGNPQMNNKQL